MRKATGNEDYRFGDLTKGAADEVKRSVESVLEPVATSITGKESYQFGDLTRKVLSDADEALATTRDAYFEELPAAMWRQLFGGLTPQQRSDVVIALCQFTAVCVLSLSLVSNLLQGAFFSVAWGLSSRHSRLSPLAAGQWPGPLRCETHTCISQWGASRRNGGVPAVFAVPVALAFTRCSDGTAAHTLSCLDSCLRPALLRTHATLRLALGPQLLPSRPSCEATLFTARLAARPAAASRRADCRRVAHASVPPRRGGAAGADAAARVAARAQSRLRAGRRVGARQRGRRPGRHRGGRRDRGGCGRRPGVAAKRRGACLALGRLGLGRPHGSYSRWPRL